MECRVGFGSQLEDREAWQQQDEAAVHVASAVTKLKVINAGAQLIVAFHLGQGP